MSRVRVYDAEDVARSMVKTFKNRDVEQVEKHPWNWPTTLRNVGDSLSVAYASDKWKPTDARGKRDWELYKHLAESRNQVFVKPGFLHDFHAPSKRWPVIGPKIYFDDVPMPDGFAALALFEEIALQLYTSGTDDSPRFGRGDDGIVKVTVRHGLLGGSKFGWSLDGDEEDEPFIFVYTKSAGVLMLITGETLDIEKDGIVG